MTSNGLRDRYPILVDEMGLYSSSAHLDFYARYLFGGVPLAGRSVLDIGGGDGVYSFLAASLGASNVVCLEPEGAGAATGASARFDQIHARLGSPGWVRRESARLQELDPTADQFDVLLLSNSINHLDEDACIALKRDEGSRRRFLEIFRSLFALGTLGAHLIVTDCSRYNFFPLLGLRNPIAPSIEWHKHQSPYLWSRLLQEAGFRDPRLQWTSFNRLGRAGRAVLGNVVASFFLTSHFRLALEK